MEKIVVHASIEQEDGGVVALGKFEVDPSKIKESVAYQYSQNKWFRNEPYKASVIIKSEDGKTHINTWNT